MVFSAHRMFVIFICIGVIAVQPDKISGLRSVDHVLRWIDHHGLATKNHRILKAAAMEDLHTEKKPAPVNATVDPNQSSKRKVRKGSDPIHNRS
ncbi:CLAVATA3/ESR (CLE)-related protein 45 [Cornus florida]|uniref:CLAVATA3/ESR (CLE)-related protein 45 n=1 Tax=Cornus florida TaxID=4283 RepID=UPI0028A28B6A|nr:CLAVATA3/ESR (CLE)-related protein 45 [Cornus florida]